MDEVGQQEKKWIREMEKSETFSSTEDLSLLVRFTGALDSYAKILVSYE